MTAHAWVLAARPKTLTAAAIPVIAASALAYKVAGAFDLRIFSLALIAALLIQIGTNFVNDAWDFKKGADTKERLGPIRATQAELIDAETMLKAAGIVLSAALLCGIPLVIHGGIPILLIGLSSIFFAWAYTAGPYPLAYNGLGELFVLVFFGVVATCGMYLLYTGSIHFYAVLLGLQLGTLSMLIIAINNLRDIKLDGVTGKRTLAVRLGIDTARKLIIFFCFLPFILGIYWVSLSPVIMFAPFIALPLAFHIAKALKTLPPSKEYNSYLAKAALLHALFGLCTTGALLWR